MVILETCFCDTIKKMKKKLQEENANKPKVWVWYCDCGNPIKLAVKEAFKPLTLEQLKEFTELTESFGNPLVLDLSEASSVNLCKCKHT